MLSGKTSVSGAMSKLTGKSLFDTDELIEKKLNMKITDIFSKFGEEYFREAETQILREVSMYDDVIISTGGGMVLKEENRRIMRETGIIISLLPDFSVIESRLKTARATRPLLMEDTNKIRKRFNLRLPFYEDCDISIKPNLDSTPESVAQKICELIQKGN